MRNPISAYRPGIWVRAAAAAGLAGLAAACSADATRVREPFFTGATANQRQIIGANQPMPAPVGTVTSASLPGASSGSWSSAGGEVVTIGPGESLDTLALKYGVPSAQIARANGISSPADIQPGRQIVIPRTSTVAYAPAPPAAAPQTLPAAAPVSGGVIQVVEPGQTLYSIARAHGVTVQEVAALNGIGPDAAIRAGQTLKIPATGAPAVQTASLTAGQPQPLGAPPKPLGTLPANGAAAASPPVNAAAQPSVPAKPVEVASVSPAAPPVPPADGQAAGPPVVKTAAVDESVDPPSANGTSFRWPVRGRIISSFGSQANGERNDGINLAVPAGTAVKAAEAGTVIYAGNELAGYGNLILVRHTDGWVSAYAHNSEITVQRGDTVQRGETIAVAGATGSVDSPQVHFELRQGAKPVNPLDYLAGA